MLARLLLALLLFPSLALADVRVAVLEFDAASTDARFAPLGKGLQSMIGTDLSQLASITVVERARLNDVMSEQQLTRSAAFDPKTTIQVGGLLGATHLIVGSFTVVGETMRLDARLLEAQSGKSLVGEKVEGEKEAFFELQKDLVKALVKGLDIAPSPKERAAIARIHTADFDAFAGFSRGIDLFDQEAYDEALKSLREVAAKDADFKLARITLDEYEDLLATLRSRRDELQTAKQELKRLEKLEKVQGQAAVVARLFEIASKSGVEAQRERLTARYLLSVAYANLGSNRGKLGDLRRGEDRFAMQRTAEALAAAYFGEATGLYPEITPVVSSRFYTRLPENADTFDDFFEDAVHKLWEHGRDYPDNRRNYLLNDLRYTRDLARLLHLDMAEEVQLRERFRDWGSRIEPEDYWKDEHRDALIKAYRTVLRLDESTALLTQSTIGVENPRVLDGITAEIEVNRDFQKLLEEAGDPLLMREWMLLAQASWSKGPVLKFGREQLGGALTSKGLHQINRFRELDDDDYVLIGEHPVWSQQAHWHLKTGPRTDQRRADSLRYGNDDPTKTLAPLLIVDGVPTEDLHARFVLRFRPSADYWPKGVRPADVPDGSRPPSPAGRPEVLLLFGLQDVDVDKVRNEETKEYELPRPTTGHAVLLADDIALLSLTESERGSYGRKEGFQWTEHARKPLRAKADTLPVNLKITGQTVKVQAAGRSFQFKLPAPSAGFYGLMIRGVGFVEVAELSLSPLKER